MTDNTAPVQIETYHPKYKESFKNLNLEWISNYFEIEPSDTQALEHPEVYILEKGGEIFTAVSNGDVLGVCALIKSNNSDYDYELAKMAVSPKAQGNGVGWQLAQSALKWAADKGASKIYLESNTKLQPAIKLYEKLGFEVIEGKSSPYKRANIQMMLTIDPREVSIILHFFNKVLLFL